MDLSTSSGQTPTSVPTSPSPGLLQMSPRVVNPMMCMPDMQQGIPTSSMNMNGSESSEPQTSSETMYKVFKREIS